MMRKEDLRAIIRDQYRNLQEEDKTIPRAFSDSLDLNSPCALVITGVRRCGKSTLVKQLMQRFSSAHYMAFEDIRLTDFEKGDFMKAEEVLVEEFGTSANCFFDEIQNVSGWEIYIRQKLDQKKKIVITGSNARLLSRELGTHLTGRHLDFELFPFSYEEYLEFTGSKDIPGSFEEYLVHGGFPEYLRMRKKEYLQHLLTDILIRDIAVRHGIRNVKALKEIAVFLLSNLGKEFSFHSLRRTFSLGAVTTVIDYISFFEESYLLFPVPRFDYSLKKQSVNPKKIYAIDNGLAIANSLSFSTDAGRMLENLVYIMLRRRFKELFYFRGEHQCDFVIRDQDKVIMVVQVCFRLNADNKEREINGLLEAMGYFGLKEGLLLTMDEEDQLITSAGTILIKTVRKWSREELAYCSFTTLTF